MQFYELMNKLNMQFYIILCVLFSSILLSSSRTVLSDPGAGVCVLAV